MFDFEQETLEYQEQRESQEHHPMLQESQVDLALKVTVDHKVLQDMLDQKGNQAHQDMVVQERKVMPEYQERMAIQELKENEEPLTLELQASQEKMEFQDTQELKESQVMEVLDKKVSQAHVVMLENPELANQDHQVLQEHPELKEIEVYHTMALQDLKVKRETQAIKEPQAQLEPQDIQELKVNQVQTAMAHQDPKVNQDRQDILVSQDHHLQDQKVTEDCLDQQVAQELKVTEDIQVLTVKFQERKEMLDTMVLQDQPVIQVQRESLVHQALPDM